MASQSYNNLINKHCVEKNIGRFLKIVLRNITVVPFPSVVDFFLNFIGTGIA